MVIIPYGIHILQDYLTIHGVSPLAPFSNKNINIDFFKSAPSASWYTENEKEISKNYFNINIIIIL